MRWYALGAVASAALLTAACEHELYLTNVPLPIDNPAVVEGPQTVVNVLAPIGMERFRTSMGAVWGKPAERRVKVARAACRTYRAREVCWTTAVDAQLGRLEGLSFASKPGGILEVQSRLTYALSPYVRRKTADIMGTIEVRARYRVRLDGYYRARIVPDGPVTFEPAHLAVGGGALDVSRTFAWTVQQRLKGVPAKLEEAVDASGVLQRVAAAWRKLHTARDLTTGAVDGTKGPWLRGRPETVVNAGFTARQAGVALAFRIEGPLTVAAIEPPPPLVTQPLPEPVNRTAGKMVTQLVLPVSVPFSSLRQRLDAGFPSDAPITTRVSPAESEVVSRVRSLRAYGSGDGVAFEFLFGIDKPVDWFPLTARMFLTGKPVLDRAAGRITIEQIGFPGRAQVQKAPEHTPVRLPLEPFATRLRTAAVLPITANVTRATDETLAKVDLPLGGGMRLRGDFAQTRIRGIAIQRDGIRVDVALEGNLSLEPDTRAYQQAAASLPSAGGSLKPSNKPTAKLQ